MRYSVKNVWGKRIKVKKKGFLFERKERRISSYYSRQILNHVGQINKTKEKAFTQENKRIEADGWRKNKKKEERTHRRNTCFC